MFPMVSIGVSSCKLSKSGKAQVARWRTLDFWLRYFAMGAVLRVPFAEGVFDPVMRDILADPVVAECLGASEMTLSNLGRM